MPKIGAARSIIRLTRWRLVEMGQFLNIFRWSSIAVVVFRRLVVVGLRFISLGHSSSPWLIDHIETMLIALSICHFLLMLCWEIVVNGLADVLI